MAIQRVNTSKTYGLLLVAVGIVSAALARPEMAASQPIDTQQSVITIRTFKSGFLKGLGDNHEIRGNLKDGSISVATPAQVHLVIEAGALRVIDPGVSDKDRSTIQTRMLGPEVLDVSRFPEIRFDSESAERTESGTWSVRGQLSLHGQKRPLAATVTENQGHYKGSFPLKQTDFGITPVTVAGGAVKVKDQIQIDFDIVAKSARMTQH